MACREFFDAYLYVPDVECDSLRHLIWKVESEVRVTSGKLGEREFVVNSELAEDSIPKAYLFFGKDVTVPVGVRSQKAGCQNGLKNLEYVVGILHDAPDSLRRGYKENIEGVMLNKLGLKTGALRYAGLYSGELDKLVVDFDDTSYL